jgi:hypothetical protein
LNDTIHVFLFTSKSEHIHQQNNKRNSIGLRIIDQQFHFSTWMSHSDKEIEEEYFQKEYLKMIEQKEDKDYLSSFVCLKKKIKF